MNKRQKRMTLADQLRKLIVDSGQSHYRLSKETGLTQPVISRFVNGDRSISLESADKLAEHFHVELSPRTDS